jgi:hypothetical protein
MAFPDEATIARPPSYREAKFVANFGAGVALNIPGSPTSASLDDPRSGSRYATDGSKLQPGAPILGSQSS